MKNTLSALLREHKELWVHSRQKHEQPADDKDYELHVTKLGTLEFLTELSWLECSSDS